MTPELPPTDSRPGRELSPWLWLGVPPLLLIFEGVVRLFGLETYQRVIHTEFGVVENATILALLICVILGVLLFLRRREVSSKLFGPWALLLTLGCVYFAGEEASWGYHLFGWEVFGALKDVNDQDEPNLHNMDGWGVLMDQLPRSLLSLAALIGGVLTPLWLGRKGYFKRMPGWLMPTLVCTPTACLALLVTVPRKIADLFGSEAAEWRGMRQGEAKEFFLAFFILMYLASLYARLKSGRLKPSA